MSEYYTDLSGIVATGLEYSASARLADAARKTTSNLEMDDFLKLMVATFQNQTIDNNADISDMMNQMVQMSVIQAISNVTAMITESSNLSYAASLVGKEVTIADSSGRNARQITGTVTGTGTLEGKQVIFLGDRSYWLSDVLAVGKLPSEETQKANERAAEEAAAAESGAW